MKTKRMATVSIASIVACVPRPRPRDRREAADPPRTAVRLVVRAARSGTARKIFRLVRTREGGAALSRAGNAASP